MTADVGFDNRLQVDGEPGWNFWTISNMFSLSRVFLLVPIFIFLHRGSEQNGNMWAAVFMGIAALTDFLDGASARLLNQRSQWGKIFDPLADKICLLSIAIFLTLPSRAYPIPWWFLVLVIMRDVIILIGSFYILGRFQHIPRSIGVGKWTTFFLALLLMSYTLEWLPSKWWLYPLRMDVLLWVSTGLVLFSGVVYAHRTIRGHFPGEEKILSDSERDAAADDDAS
jgi:CDP-diacylglycerol--glycerol-3-phosphate 3-phosphatidyltransferase